MNDILEECVHWLHSKQWKEKKKEKFKMKIWISAVGTEVVKSQETCEFSMCIWRSEMERMNYILIEEGYSWLWKPEVSSVNVCF